MYVGFEPHPPSLPLEVARDVPCQLYQRVSAMPDRCAFGVCVAYGDLVATEEGMVRVLRSCIRRKG